MTFSTRNYWVDRYAEQGDSYVATGGSAEKSDEQFVSLLPCLEALVPTAGRILDFGCGPGRFRSFLASRGEYVGVDLIPGLGTEELGETLPTGFDCTVAVMVLQHIVEEDEYKHWVEQLFASMKPGGVLVVVDHDPMEDPDPHMLPRGYLSILDDPACEGFHHSHAYEGHWIGTFDKRPWQGEAGVNPVFRKVGDSVGLHEDSVMPNVMVMNTELLAKHDPQWMTRDRDTVDIHLSNGHWVYEIAGWRDRQAEVVCEIKYREEE